MLEAHPDADTALQLLRAADYLGVQALVPRGHPFHAMASVWTEPLDEVGARVRAGLEEAPAEPWWLLAASQLAWQRGQPAAVVARARRLLALLAPTDPRVVDAWLLLGPALSQLGDRHSCQVLAERATKRALEGDDDWLIGRALLNESISFLTTDRDRARALHARASERLARWPYGVARCQLPAPRLYGLEPAPSLAAFRAAEAVFVQGRNRTMTTLARIGAARSLRLLDRFDDAEAVGRKAMDWARPHQRIVILAGLERVARRRGDAAGQDRLVAQMVDAQSHPYERGLVGLAALGRALRRGERADAERYLAWCEGPRLPASELWDLIGQAADWGADEDLRARLAAVAYDRSAPSTRLHHQDTVRALAPSSWPYRSLAIDGRLGKGGMATVWSARDRRTGSPCALKVLDVGDTEALLTEVRAVAQLHHPHILSVLDQGVTPPSLALLSGGAIAAGRPWMTMPRLAGGSLTTRCGRLPWTAARTVLDQLLSALAHAHAAGILHLDVKPDNVLLTAPDGPPAARLADFGLAQAVGTGPTEVVGTPAYMAPEQLRGDVRWWGPPTDLYALGCLAWHLLTGQPPFRGPTRALRAQHLTADLPPFRPTLAVPDRLDAWLGSLLAKDPRDRFPDAAHARAALASLGEAVERSTAVRPPTPEHLETVDLGGTFELDLDLPVGEAPAPGPRPVEGWPSPRLPPQPRYVGDRLGAASALAALRAQPVIGREPLQRRLWATVRAAAAGRPAGVMLTGEGGLGAGRLVEWLVREVREAGGARVLRSRLVAAPGVEEGFGGMVRHWLRATGLTDEALEAWLATSPWRPDTVDVPTLRAALDADREPGRLRPLLTRLAQEGPLLWVVEQLHHQPAALAIAQDLLTAGGPVMVLATSQDAPADLPAPWCVEVLERPSVEAAEGIADAVVPLVLPQRQRLIERCDRHPGRIVRTLKRLDERGLCMPDGVRFRIPWSELEAGEEARMLPPLEGAERARWWAAAVLGGAASEEEVERAVRALGEVPRPSLRLPARRGRVELADDQRQAVLRQLRELGCFEEVHAAVAEVLDDRSPWNLVRRGRLRAAAGELLAGADDLLAGAMELAPTVAEPVLQEREALLEAALLPDDDPRWLAGFAAEVNATGGRNGPLVGREERLVARLLADGDPTQRALARLTIVTSRRNEQDRAEATAELNLVMDDDRVDPVVRARAALAMGYHAIHHHEPEVLRRCLARADRWLPADHELRVAIGQMDGKQRQQAGDLLGARAVLEEVAARPAAQEVRLLQYVHAVLGDVCRDLGDLDAAERSYRAALAISRRHADVHQYVDELNLVVLDALRGRLEDHAERLPGLCADIERTQYPPLAVFAWWLRLVLPNPPPVADTLLRSAEVLDRYEWWDRELAHVGEQVARRLVVRGHPREAEDLRAFIAARQSAV